MSQILEFTSIKKKTEADQDEADKELTENVNALMGTYQMEGAFFLLPYQIKILGEAEYVFMDVTYTGNTDFPYLLNFDV